MPTLSRANIKQRCLTCLLKLENTHSEAAALLSTDSADGASSGHTDFCLQTELKNLSINLSTNAELLQQLSKFVERQVCRPDLPQQLCLYCYNKLQSFEKFRRRARYAYERLMLVLSAEIGDLVVEYDEDEEQQQSAREPVKLDDDIYNVLLKNTLLETESVLLDNTTAGVTLQLPDPFDDEVTARTPSKSDSDAEAEGYNDSIYSSDDDAPSEDNDTAAMTTPDKTSPVPTPKQRRRTKKQTTNNADAACLPAAVIGSDMDKLKRRNKGTKNNFKCAQCNHSFAHKLTHDAHVRKVHEGSKRPFQCDRCEKAYTFIGGLYTHIKEIHEAEVRSYACDHAGCTRNYTSFIAMQKHKRLKHATETLPEKKFVCEQCGATFNQSGNLKYHRRTKHPTAAEAAEKELEKQRYYCDICQKQFHSRYTLKYHMLQLHAAADDVSATKYTCEVCGRRMAKKFMLVQHMLVHSTEKMPCEHCGKQFIRKFELEAHIRAVHMKLKPFSCKYCTECFASRKTLRHHEYIHTGEKPYVCDVCGLAYRQQTCLKNHRKSHDKSLYATDTGATEAALFNVSTRASADRAILMNTFLAPTTTPTPATLVETSKAAS